MRMPTVKTVQVYKAGREFKAFELSATHTIDYEKLIKLIDCFCKSECPLQHFDIIPKSTILEFWKSKLWEEGNNFFKRELPDQDRIAKIDDIIKKHWFEIWQDRHNK